jgi:O-succinylbenzoate synthase
VTIDAIEMAAESLRRQFVRQVDEATFPFVQGLRELADFARQCREASSSDRVAVAFALERSLREAAYQLDDHPVIEAEAIALGNAILDSVARAVEFLNGRDDDPIEIVASLSRALD